MQGNQVTHTLRFLGTGAASGVPSFYCGCKACEEALANPAARRTCAGLLIKGAENTLIDASPDLRLQLSLAGAAEIHRVLFTHEHFDHIGGVPQLEYYVRLVTKEPLPFYAGKHTLETIAVQFAFMSDTFTPQSLEAGQTVEFDGVRYTALLAPHGIQTFGFIIERVGGTRRIAYFPDTALPSEEVLQAFKGIDVLIIDATFNGTNWMPASHLSIAEAIQLAERVGAEKTFLTHLAMHYDEPITAQELQMQLAPYKGRILVANDGLEIPL